MRNLLATSNSDFKGTFYNKVRTGESNSIIQNQINSQNIHEIDTFNSTGISASHIVDVSEAQMSENLSVDNENSYKDDTNIKFLAKYKSECGICGIFTIFLILFHIIMIPISIYIYTFLKSHYHINDANLIRTCDVMKRILNLISLSFIISFIIIFVFKKVMK
jgi:hypothetical protein